MQKELQELSGVQVMKYTHSQLRRGRPLLGTYYTHLANVLETPPPALLEINSPSTLTTLLRTRQAPVRDGFTSDYGLSSSPSTASDAIPSSSPFQGSTYGSPIDRSHYEDRVKSEEVSRALASEFFGVICDLARDPAQDPTQDPNQGWLAFTCESRKYNIPPLDATCVDDGSFVLKKHHHGNWQRQDLNAYCCLEVKPVHKKFTENGKDDIGVVTDEEWAQRVGEMLGMAFRRMGDDPRPPEASRHLFLISAYQNMHRFIYTYLSDEYISYLRDEDPSAALLDSQNCFLEIYESREYDHSKADDRVDEAIELKAMINFIESNLPQ